MGSNSALWDAYRKTWDTFSQSLERLQVCVAQGERSAIAAALQEVEKSKAEHNIARDRLAEQLAGAIAAKDIATARSEQDRIREKAQLLWELSGKPQNSAEADWFTAERLVRSSTAR